MFIGDMQIAGFDDALFDAMEKEVARQEAHIELIASENYASLRVMEAQGTPAVTTEASAKASARSWPAGSAVFSMPWPRAIRVLRKPRSRVRSRSFAPAIRSIGALTSADIN